MVDLFLGDISLNPDTQKSFTRQPENKLKNKEAKIRRKKYI